MMLVLRRLSQVIESFLEVEWFGGYLLRSVTTQMSLELVQRAQERLVRRALFLTKIFFIPG